MDVRKICGITLEAGIVMAATYAAAPCQPSDPQPLCKILFEWWDKN